MEFQIPKTFELGGQTISIEFKDMIANTPGMDGQASYGEQLIELKNGMKPEYTQFVFFHELVHHILSQMGEDKLRGTEKFVNEFATFLHQAIKTMNRGDTP